jgi:hypothetical protein
MGRGQKERARAEAAAAEPAGGLPAAPTLADFLSFPPLQGGSAPAPPATPQPESAVHGKAPPLAQGTINVAGPPYMVLGSKKGGFPVSIESRAKGKKVTPATLLTCCRMHPCPALLKLHIPAVPPGCMLPCIAGAPGHGDTQRQWRHVDPPLRPEECCWLGRCC